jgi:putative membrane protein
MPNRFTRFLIHWIAISLSLWVASRVFSGIRFADAYALVIAALVLGFVNAIVRPLLVILTLPLTVLTLGLFLLVLNALMLMLVAWLVSGFVVSDFLTAFLASIFISIVSYVIGAILGIGAKAA